MATRSKRFMEATGWQQHSVHGFFPGSQKARSIWILSLSMAPAGIASSRPQRLEGRANQQGRLNDGTSGQVRRNSDAASIEFEIARLRDLDLKAFRPPVAGVTGRAAPSHLPKHLLFAMFAYRIQCGTFGDLDAASLKLSKAAAGSGIEHDHSAHGQD
jgi:hypothetical protein